MGSIRSACFSLLLVACLSTMGCTGQLFRDFGRFNLNGETTQAFESYSVNPDYRYYISGPDIYPNAIIGIHRDYRIDPDRLWKEVEMTPTVMRTLVENMKQKTSTESSFSLRIQSAGPERPADRSLVLDPDGPDLPADKKRWIRSDRSPDLDTYEQLNRETGLTLESG